MILRFRLVISRGLENPLIRRILRNSAYLFSATGLAAGMSFFQSVLSGRLLGPDLFGVLGVLTTFTSVVNRFASFRIDELVVRYVSHYQQQQQPHKAAAVFKLAGLLEILGSLLAFALIWWLAPTGAQYLARDLSLVVWFRIYGSIVLVNLIYESATGLLQIFDRFRVIATVTTFQSAVTLLLIVVAFLAQGNLVWIVVAYMVGKVIASLAITGAALQQAWRAWGPGWWRTPLNILRGERRSLLTFAFSTNLSSSVSLVSKDSEMLWVSAFLGTEQAGYYKTALALTNLLQLPISPLPKATFPELAREIASRSWANVRYVLRQGSRLAAAYSIPVMLGLVIFGRWLITATYGLDYLPAYAALVILLVGYTFANIFYWNRVALLSLARPVFPTIVNFIGMLFKVSGIFILVPHLGYLAFAGLLSGYYIFTVGIAASRVYWDLRGRTEQA